RPRLAKSESESSSENLPEENIIETLSKLTSEQLTLLTLKLKKKNALSQKPNSPVIVQKPRTDYLPLSYAQQRLWFFDQLNPGQGIYSRPAAIKLSGSLRSEVLQRCLDELVRRHEVLRTVFVTEEGRPRQVIKKPETGTLRLEDLCHLPADEKQSRIN